MNFLNVCADVCANLSDEGVCNNAQKLQRDVQSSFHCKLFEVSVRYRQGTMKWFILNNPIQLSLQTQLSQRKLSISVAQAEYARLCNQHLRNITSYLS